MFAPFGLIAAAAVINLTIAAGWFVTPGPIVLPILWMVTIGAFVAATALAGQAVAKRWDGVLVDRQNRISLSRFQLVGWTLLILSALFAAGLQNIFRPGAGALGILDITIQPEIWGLLGLSAFTAVTSAVITSGQEGEEMKIPDAPVTMRGSSTPSKQRSVAAVVDKIRTDDKIAEPIAVGRTIQKASPSDARWIDMIRGDSEGADYIDVAKFQQLIITILIITVYGAQLWQTFAAPGFIAEFKAPSSGLLALIGVSHATYLADKKLVAS